VGDGAKLYLDTRKERALTMQAVALQVDDSFARELPASYLQERWYAAYTCANHEKRVATQLEARAVEHFLPLYRSVRRWSDRRVQLELPLFPAYVFVRLALCDRLSVLEIPSLVRLVGFGGLPAAIPDGQVEILRSGLVKHLNAEPHPFLAVGRKVRIVRGPLVGLEGILLRRKGRYRFVLSLEVIQRSIVVDVDGTDVVPVAVATEA
jgi:transcriptional antiterminator NusG